MKCGLGSPHYALLIRNSLYDEAQECVVWASCPQQLASYKENWVAGKARAEFSVVNKFSEAKWALRTYLAYLNAIPH